MIKKYVEKRKERKRLIRERRKEIGVFREYFELFSEVLIYVFFVFNGLGSGGSSSDDSGFPFFIIYSSWPAIFVAIFVPIMAQKRQEAKRKEEELRNQIEE